MRYELTHDSLARKVYAKVSSDDRTRRKIERFIRERHGDFLARGELLSKKDLDYIDPYLTVVQTSKEEDKFIDRSRRSAKRKRLVLFGIIGAVLVLLSAFSMYANFQQDLAVKNAELAEQRQQEALDNAAEARTNAERADNQRAKADSAKDIAVAEREKAEIAEENAIKEKGRADKAATEARENEKKAIQARDEAKKQKDLADIAREKAEESDSLARIAQDKAIKEKVRAEKAGAKNKQLRLIAMAKSMAAKSQKVDDPRLKALVSVQAFEFNRQNGGDANDPDIYDGIYDAWKTHGGDPRALTQPHKGSPEKASGAVRSLTFSPNGDMFTTGSDGDLFHWEASGNSRRMASNHIVNRSLAMDPDGQYLAGAGDAPFIQLFDLKSAGLSGRQAATAFDYTSLNGHDGQVWDIAFLPDGKGFLSSGADGWIRFYDLKKGQFQSLVKVDADIKMFAVPGDKALFSGIDEYGKLYLWKYQYRNDSLRLSGGHRPFEEMQEQFSAIEMNKAGDLLVAGTSSGKLLLWDTGRRHQRGETLIGHRAKISCIRFNPDESQLASGGYDGLIQLWEMKKLDQLPVVMRDHADWVMTLAFDPNAQLLVSGTKDGRVNWWPLDRNAVVNELCDKVDPGLTQKEWILYVGTDVDYQPTCSDDPTFNVPIVPDVKDESVSESPPDTLNPLENLNPAFPPAPQLQKNLGVNKYQTAEIDSQLDKLAFTILNRGELTYNRKAGFFVRTLASSASLDARLKQWLDSNQIRSTVSEGQTHIASNDLPIPFGPNLEISFLAVEPPGGPALFIAFIKNENDQYLSAKDHPAESRKTLDLLTKILRE